MGKHTHAECEGHKHCGGHHRHDGHEHHDHGCCCHHHHHAPEGNGGKLKKFLPEIITASLFVTALVVFHYMAIPQGKDIIELAAYILAVLPVGIPILTATLREWRKGNIFNEFTLMLLSSVGAFCILEYPEGVAVLLLYSIGEKLEEIVSGDVRSQIKNLLGKMPKFARVILSGGEEKRKPEDVSPGDMIVVRPGESIPLDGYLENLDGASFDTSAMTGESVPRTYGKGDEVSAGLIPVDKEVRIRVSKPYKDSAMMRIMAMIENSSANRAPSETVLRRITRWYTPVVLAASIILFVVPWIVSLMTPSFTFEWTDWLRRSLVFLVCSCPCALVVSIPLTYFASIGIASKRGILFKGHRQLDDMRKFTSLLLDKTGTVTTGKFHVTGIFPSSGITSDRLLSLAAGVDSESSHPLARAICDEAESKKLEIAKVSDVRTVSHGMSALHEGKTVLLGSRKLLSDAGISTPEMTHDASTLIYIAIGDDCAGCIALADTVKDGAKEAVEEIHRLGIKRVGILSGDRSAAVADACRQIGADSYDAELFPAQKEKIVAECEKRGELTAFAGDGINDAPALAASSVGIAMGTLGSDIAIESADVVISGDDLRKIPEGIKISRKVRSLLIENISFAFGVKLLVMTLGAFGIATLWAAVFADTGVTLVAVIWTLCRLKIWKLKK